MTAELRIAYLTGEYPKASMTFILREIEALRKTGVTVGTAAIRRPTPADLIGPEEERAEAETFYVLSAAKSPLRLLRDHAALFAAAPSRWLKALGLAWRTGRPGAKGRLWQMFYFLEAGVIARWMEREGFAHLHNHFADSSANVAMLTSALSARPFSFTLHGPAELFEPESWHLGEKVARADATICISHFARSQAMLFSDPAHWEKLHIVHCGVIPERYEAPLPQGDGLKLLFVGRLTAIKGLRVLFDAFERLRRTRPDATLTLVGDGPDRPWAEAEAARIGGIDLLGFQSQSGVAEALARSDALVLPSFAEGVPVVLMEAMAASRPVIATRVGGVGELVEHGVSGLVVAPGDATGLRDALDRLAADPDARRTMGEAGRRKVCAEYDLRQEAKRLKAIFATGMLRSEDCSETSMPRRGNSTESTP